jgi:hypothetical protein
MVFFLAVPIYIHLLVVWDFVSPGMLFSFSNLEHYANY